MDFAPGVTAKLKRPTGAGIGDETYFRTFYGSRTPGWYAWLLAEVIRHGRPGNVLDLGCGLGLFVELANQWGISAKGIDASEAAMRIALARSPHLDLCQCDLTQPLPFAEQSFANIVMHQVIAHLPPGVIKKVLTECYRVLLPGGLLFVYSPAKSNRPVLERDPTHRSPLHPSELRAELESAGFVVISEPNSARFSPRYRVLAKCATRLMRTRLRDWIAGTANAYARRPLQ